MTKAVYVGVAGKARKVKKGYIGVGGKARKITKAYVGVGGVARPFWGGGELAYYGTITGLSQARRMMAASSIGDYALIGGGVDSKTAYATVDAYDSSLTRSTPSALSSAAFEVAATTVGGYALFAGGAYIQSSNYMARNTVTAYDASLTKTTATTLSANINNARATTVGKYALIGGGIKRSFFLSSLSDVVHAYDESLTRSTPTALSQARHSCGAAAVGGYALFAGGGITIDEYGAPWFDGSISSVVSTVDAYDESLTRSTPTALSDRRGNAKPATVGNYALFAGGESSAQTSVVDVYDPSLTRTLASNLSGGTTSVRSSTTINGYALFVGGNDYADAYDESLAKTIPATPTVGSRYGAAAAAGDYAVFAAGARTSGTAGTTNVFAYVVN